MVLAAVAVAIVVEKSARTQALADLTRSQQVFVDEHAARAARLELIARVVAEEPRLKAVVATPGVDHRTVLGVAEELRAAVDLAFFIITDAQGNVLADVLQPDGAGDLSGLPLFAAAQGSGHAEGVLTDEDRAFQIDVRRMRVGTHDVGWLLIGQRLDDAVAEAVARDAGTSVLLSIDQKPLAAASPDGLSRDILQQLLVTSVGGSAKLASREFLTVSDNYPETTSGLRYAMVASLDRALQPGRRLLFLLGGILLAALPLGLFAAGWISRRLSQPLVALSQLADRIGAGELNAQSQAFGPREATALGESMNRMAHALQASRAALVEQQRLEKELEIAARIQTAILPKVLSAPRLQISAIMRPATEVGGDYYDIIAAPNGCWLAIGDVAGHGLTSGLVMMMVQSVLGALARKNPESPAAIINDVNAVLFDNIRHRLEQDEHVTLNLMRYTDDGTLRFAGAHEDLIICPQEGAPQIVPTPGMWVGATEDISGHTTEHTTRLAPGDLLILHTDGMTEALNTERKQFGIERLADAVAKRRRLPVQEIRDQIMQEVLAWGTEQTDDMTLVVIRYV